MKATMRNNTAGLRTGQRVTVTERDGMFVTVQDSLGNEHPILEGDLA